MKFHRYSEIFPLIEGPAFDDLVLDIKMNGQKEKIWLYEGQILDGRNRWNACKRAGVKPETRIYHGKDPLKFVLSLNMHRRHLSESQRSMVASRLAAIEAEDARLSQSQAAAVMNVGRRSVQRATQVREKGSKQLQDSVDSGETSVSKAASVLHLPKNKQLAAAKAPAEPATEEAPADPRLSEGWQPDQDDDACMAIAEKSLAASLDAVLAADDKLAAAKAEIERLNTLVSVLTVSRDGYQTTHGIAVRALKAEKRKTARLEREFDSLKAKLAKQ